MSPSATSTTAQGNLCQGWTNLSMKKFSLIFPLLALTPLQQSCFYRHLFKGRDEVQTVEVGRDCPCPLSPVCTASLTLTLFPLVLAVRKTPHHVTHKGF